MSCRPKLSGWFVGGDFGVHCTTVGKTFNSGLINRKMHWRLMKANSHGVQGLKCLVGAAYCTHIEIKKPMQFGGCYINPKGYTSINVQVTCDPHEKVHVDASWPGSIHDVGFKVGVKHWK